METSSNLFKQLVADLMPTLKDRLAMAQHVSSIRTRLTASFELKRFFLIGSQSRNTSISGLSDYDYIAVFPKTYSMWGNTRKSSATFLKNIRDDLAERFWNTDVSKNGQAIVVPFSNGDRVFDVVPAIFGELNQFKRPTFWIADGAGGWIETSPEAHDAYIEEADRMSGHKLKNVARLFKFWRFSRAQPVYLSSFHTELLLADSEICTGIKTYGQCLLELMKLLSKRECRALQDPLGISGWVYAGRTLPQIENALGMLELAIRHGEKAQEAARIGKHQQAIHQWNITFNGAFDPYIK